MDLLHITYWACLLGTALAGKKTIMSDKMVLSDNRIVGGVIAEEGGYPYQVSLRMSGNYHTCGGSILSETIVLTAAHCVKPQVPLTVVTGSNKLDTGGDVYRVKKAIAHPNYDRPRLINDIALVKTATPMVFNSRVQPIKLPMYNTKDGTTLLITGWGLTNYPGDIPNELQAIRLKTIGVAECIERLQFSSVSQSQICTLAGYGEGICMGDSGGPLVDVSTNEVIGVASFVIPCAKGHPDVFTRVISFKKWILDTAATMKYM